MKMDMKLQMKTGSSCQMRRLSNIVVVVILEESRNAQQGMSSYVITPIFIETFCLREMIVKDLNCGLQAQSGQHPHVFISDSHRLISAVCAAFNVLV